MKTNLINKLGVVSLLVMASVLGGIMIMHTASAQSTSTEEVNTQNVSAEDIDASISNVQIINKVDNDGDGYHSSFEVRITADTKCFGCLPEPQTDRDMEPWFEIWINDEFPPSGDFEARSVIVENSESLTTTLRVNEDFVDNFERGTAEVGVRYWESDTGAETGDNPDPGQFLNQLIRPPSGGELWGLTQVKIEPASGDPENEPPTASFTLSPSNPTTSDTVTFDASGSSDADGTIQTYAWDFDGDGTTDQTGSSPTATHSYSSVGTFDATLTVTDNDEATETATQTVSVGDSPDPIPTFTFSPSNPTTSGTVMFDGSDSSVPDGSITSYLWDFGDGTTATGQTATHSFPGPGNYAVTLTVTASDGATNTTLQTVSVTDDGATVGSSSLRVNGTGETGESAIEIEADNGLSIARVNISVNTSVAEITGVQEGADVDSSQPTTNFDVINQTADSARIEFSNIQAQANPVQEFELARIELEAQTDDGDTPIQVLVDQLRDGNQNEYSTIGENEGTFSVGDELFPDSLPGFNAPPTNTGQLDPSLYEDISGDGDGLDPSQTVTLWTELVLNPQDFDDLTQQQIDALDWNGDGSLSPSDAVSLWTEQVLAN